MKWNFFLVISIFLGLSFFFTIPAYANGIWISLLQDGNAYSFLSLVFISIVLEALAFRIFINKVTSVKALLMSCFANTVTAIAGAVFYAFLIILILAMAVILRLPYNPTEQSFIITIGANIVFYSYFFLMFAGSCYIELMVLRFWFGYSGKQLLIPVFGGNLVTYSLVWFYKYFIEVSNSFFHVVSQGW